MFKPVKNTSISKKVIEQIKDMLSDGTLKKGDRLPSERSMAETLEISRSSVREAMKELEIMGLVETKPGEGNFVKENFEDILFEPFSTMFLIRESSTEEILELREVIEKGNAGLAARRITDQELSELRSILDQAKSSNDEDLLVELDLLFHYKIAQASKNFLLQSILNAVSSLIEFSIQDTRKNILIEDSHKENIIDQHEKIYQALADKNPTKGEKAMLNHLDYVNNQMEKALK